MYYVKAYELATKQIKLLNQQFALTCDELCNRYGLKRNENPFSLSAAFETGFSMDIVMVICEGSEFPYIDTILFDKNGQEVCRDTSNSETVTGRHQLQTDEDTYQVILIAEKTEEVLSKALFQCIEMLREDMLHTWVFKDSDEKAVDDYLFSKLDLTSDQVLELYRSYAPEKIPFVSLGSCANPIKSVDLLDAKFVSVWDGDIQVVTNCKVNPITKEVVEVEPSNKLADNLTTLEYEFITIADAEFSVVDKSYEEKSEGGYWYETYDE